MRGTLYHGAFAVEQAAAQHQPQADPAYAAAPFTPDVQEHDRQRVLIQITQNLATRIRNSHAFNLPTFYLPRDESADCTIPNAIGEPGDSHGALRAVLLCVLATRNGDCENRTQSALGCTAICRRIAIGGSE